MIYPLIASICWGLTYSLLYNVLKLTSTLNWILINNFFSILWINLYKKDSFSREIFYSWEFWIALLTSQIGYFFSISSIQKIGGQYTSIIEISYPLFTAFFGFLIFKNEININFFIGTSLIIIGLLFISKDIIY